MNGLPRLDPLYPETFMCTVNEKSMSVKLVPALLIFLPEREGIKPIPIRDIVQKTKVEKTYSFEYRNTSYTLTFTTERSANRFVDKIIDIMFRIQRYKKPKPSVLIKDPKRLDPLEFLWSKFGKNERLLKSYRKRRKVQDVWKAVAKLPTGYFDLLSTYEPKMWKNIKKSLKFGIPMSLRSACWAKLCMLNMRTYDNLHFDLSKNFKNEELEKDAPRSLSRRLKIPRAANEIQLLLQALLIKSDRTYDQSDTFLATILLLIMDKVPAFVIHEFLWEEYGMRYIFKARDAINLAVLYLTFRRILGVEIKVTKFDPTKVPAQYVGIASTLMYCFDTYILSFCMNKASFLVSARIIDLIFFTKKPFRLLPIILFTIIEAEWPRIKGYLATEQPSEIQEIADSVLFDPLDELLPTDDDLSVVTDRLDAIKRRYDDIDEFFGKLVANYEELETQVDAVLREVCGDDDDLEFLSDYF